MGSEFAFGDLALVIFNSEDLSGLRVFSIKLRWS